MLGASQVQTLFLRFRSSGRESYQKCLIADEEEKIWVLLQGVYHVAKNIRSTWMQLSVSKWHSYSQYLVVRGIQNDLDKTEVA